MAEIFDAIHTEYEFPYDQFPPAKVKDNLVELPCPTPPAEVLAEAGCANLKEVVVLGYEADGKLYMIHSGSMSYWPNFLWILEQARGEIVKRTMLA